MGAPSTANPHPLEKKNSIKVPIEFVHTVDPNFFYCTFYTVMTHLVLDSMLPRMNTFNIKNVNGFQLKVTEG